MEYSKQELLEKLKNTKTMRANLIVRKDNLLQSIEQLSEQITLLENRLISNGGISRTNKNS